MKMRKGFTLIELLIVLAIIAALMAVVTPIALNAVKKAKATQVAENFRNIKSAVESYFYVEGQPPTDLAELVTKGYLNNADTDNYTLYKTNNGDGSYTFEVDYSGKDVDGDTLTSVYADAAASTVDETIYYVRFTVRSW